jgi:hypothetical protein
MKKQTVIVIFLCLFVHQMFAQTAKATIKADVKWGAYTDKKTAKQLGIAGQNTIIYGDETNLYSLNYATKIIPYVGPNTKASCVARRWMYKPGPHPTVRPAHYEIGGCGLLLE